MNPTCTAAAAPSGKSIVVYPSSPVTSLSSGNASQTLTFNGGPAGNAFTLTFNGQTTASIPAAVVPPSIYELWTFPTIIGHVYDLGTNFYVNNGNGYTWGYEAMIGGVSLGLNIVTGGPSEVFTDGTTCPSSALVNWITAVSGVTATATSMSLRCTSNIGAIFQAGCRVYDRNTSTAAHYSVAGTPSNFSAVGGGGGSGVSNVNVYGGTEWDIGSSGLGETVSITGGGAVLLAALAALSNVGPDCVQVVDNSGSGSGNYAITFVGQMANQSQPTITASDPAAVITVVSAGGGGPTLTYNGSGVALGQWIYCEGSPLPYAIARLPQQTPASQTAIVGMLPYFVPEGSYPFDDRRVGDSSAVSGNPIYFYHTGASSGFQWLRLTPGTYKLYVTYPIDNYTHGGTTFVPSTATQFVVDDPSGNNLTTVSVDQSQPLTDYIDGNSRGWKLIGTYAITTALDGLTLVMTGVGQSAVGSGNQPVAILDAALLVRTAGGTAGVTIGPGDTVSLSVPSGWMTTQAGAILAQTVSVSPPTSILPAPSAGGTPLEVGYNVVPVAYFSDYITHANLLYLMPTFGDTQDSNGYPTTLVGTGGYKSQPILEPTATLANADPLQGSSAALPVSGNYWLTWDGSTTNVQVTSPDSRYCTVTELTQYQHLPGTTGNRRVYQIAYNPLAIARPYINLGVLSTVLDESDETGQTYTVSVTNWALYPPDPSDPTGNTLWGYNSGSGTFTRPDAINPFLPSYLPFFDGMQGIRDLDTSNTNANAYTTAAGIKPATHANRISAASISGRIPIVSVGPAPTPWPVATVQPQILVQTSAPITGLIGPGLYVTLDSVGTLAFTGGSYSIGAYASDPWPEAMVAEVIDSHNFTILPAFGASGGSTARATVITGTVTPGNASVVLPDYGSIWPNSDLYALFAACPQLTYWHKVLPPNIDCSNGGAAYQIALDIATNLRSGVNVSIELGNEIWNEAGLCNNYGRYAEARRANIEFDTNFDYEIWYANQRQAMGVQVLAAFTAMGRAGDVRHLYALRTADDGNASAIVGQAHSNGAPLDQVAIATYTNNWPFAGYTSDQLPEFNWWEADQLLDHRDLVVAYGGYAEAYVGILPAILATNGYSSATIVAYEGSPSVLVPVDPIGDIATPPGNTPNFATRQQTMRRHPRSFGNVVAEYQAFRAAGLSRASWYNVGGSGGGQTWNSFEYGGQGLGTGTSADTVNLDNPLLGKDSALNEQGGAWAYLGGLASPPIRSRRIPGRARAGSRGDY